MVEFIVPAGVLLQILRYVEASGKNTKGENKAFMLDCVLEVKKSGIIINAVEESGALITKIKLALDKSKVKKTGKIPIDLEESITALKRYSVSDEITVTFPVDDSLIQYVRKKPWYRVKCHTISLDSVTTIFNKEDDDLFKRKGDVWIAANGIQLDTIIKVNAKEFKEIVADGEMIQERNFPFKVSSKKVIVTVEDAETGRGTGREIITKEIKCKDTITSIYSFGFGNIFSVLSGNLTIWMCDAGPMIIQNDDDFIKLTYILATTEMEDEDEESSDDEDTESSENEDDINYSETPHELEESLDDLDIVEDDEDLEEVDDE